MLPSRHRDQRQNCLVLKRIEDDQIAEDTSVNATSRGSGQRGPTRPSGGRVVGQSSYPIYAGGPIEPQGILLRRGQPNVSVGPAIDRRDVVIPPPSARVPALFPSLTNEKAVEDFIQASRQIPTSNKGVIPVAARVPIPTPPVIRPPASTAGHAGGLNKTTQPKRLKDTTMDLGDVLGTAIGYYKDYQVAQSIPDYVSGKYGGTNVLQTTPALGVPFVDVVPENNMKGMVWNPRAACGNGAWVKSRRKRRKRLATVSDIKDLAALKSVLGGGKAFETWIATHA